MVNNPYENYRRMQVDTASPGRLLLMLYDGALKNLRQAQKSIEEKKTNRAHNCLIKAQDIVMQLNLDLNMEAGEIAYHLRDLYLYIYQRLIEANVKKDTTIIQEAIGLLSELKEAWDAIILKTKSAATP